MAPIQAEIERVEKRPWLPARSVLRTRNEWR